MGNEKVFLAGLIILGILAAHLPGQSMSAKIVGTVKNEEGAVLSGVTVTAINIGKNAEVTCNSDKGGTFRLLGLTPGYYQVSFDLRGYQSYTAAGISLTVEQSLTLHIKLKKAGLSTDKETLLSTETETIAADPAAFEESEHEEKMRSYKDWGRFSLHFNYGVNCMTVGDSNAYLRSFSGTSQRITNYFATLHGGTDLNAEIGYRITPRLEIGVGMGLVQGHLRNNDLKTWAHESTTDTYISSLNVKAIPLKIFCRYGLGHSTWCYYSIYGAIDFNFATWQMDNRNWQDAYPHVSNYILNYERLESASGHGLGVMAGGRAEVVLEENFALTFDLSARYAPLRNFSGRSEYTQFRQFSKPQISHGQLWFFEYYDKNLGKWVWNLGIGDRPTGPETRNVSSAKVDFSGLALRVGVMFKF